MIAAILVTSLFLVYFGFAYAESVSIRRGEIPPRSQKTWAGKPFLHWDDFTVQQYGDAIGLTILNVGILGSVAWASVSAAEILVSLVVGSLIANFGGLGINFVKVPASLIDTFSFPTVEGMKRLLDPSFMGSAIGMAFVASAETLLCAAATDRLSGRSKTNYDKELFAQGVGNTLAGLVGALPITGVIVRSSANVEAGATTRWSAVAHGAWLLILVAAVPVLLTGIYAMSKRKEKIATDEMNVAVAAAVEQANTEAKANQKAEIEALNKMKQKEIDNAVKKALEEAAKPKAEDKDDAQPEKAEKKPSEEGS